MQQLPQKHYRLITSVLIAGVVFKLLAFSFIDTSPERDFVQEYLIAEAILQRLSLSTPVSEMGEVILGHNIQTFPHVSPHPPTVGFIFLPFAMFSFPAALALWRLVSVLLTLLVVREVYEISKSGRKHFTLAAGLWLFSAAFLVDFKLGQINILKLFFEILALSLFLKGRLFTSGALAGLAFITKLGGWPLLVLYGLNMKLRPIFSFSIVVAACFGALEIFNPGFSTISFFTETLRQNTSIYLQGHGNISIAGVYAKLIHGFVFDSLSPSVAGKDYNLNFVVLFSAIGVCVWWAYFRIKDNASRGMFLLAASSFLTPVSWINTVLPVWGFLTFYYLRSKTLPSLFYLLALLTLYRADLFLYVLQELWLSSSNFTKSVIVHSVGALSVAVFTSIFALSSRLRKIDKLDSP